MPKLRNKHRMDENFDPDEHREKEKNFSYYKKAQTAKGTEWKPQRKLQVKGNRISDVFRGFLGISLPAKSGLREAVTQTVTPY